MPLTPKQQESVRRLAEYYDGDSAYDAVTNPGGLRRGGNLQNFVPALQDTAAAVKGAASLVMDAQTSASDAALARDAAQTIVAEVVDDTGQRLHFATITGAGGAMQATIPQDIGLLYIGGNSVQGIGPNLYRKARLQAAGPGKFASVDGAFWEPTDGPLAVETLGAGAGSPAADLAAIKASRTLSPVARLDAAADVTGQEFKAIDGFDLVLRGRGMVKGLYRKRVIPDIAPSDHMECLGDLLPGTHTSRYSATQAPIVLTSGDSLTSQWANGNGIQGHLANVIEEWVRKDCQARGATPTFYHRGFGGQSWQTFAGLPSAGPNDWPNWYVDRTILWLNYICDLLPDLLFLSFGMNLSNGGEEKWIRQVLQTISTWAKVPDVVILTNTVPRPFGPENPTFFEPASFTESRIKVAGLVRSLVKSGRLPLPVGLIDINRKNMMVQFGVDPCTSALRTGEISTPTAAPQNTFLANEQVESDYEAVFTFDPAKLVLGGPQIIFLPLGGGVNDVVQIGKSGGNDNSYVANFNCGLGGSGSTVWLYAQVPFSIAPDASSGLVTLRAAKSDGMFRLIPTAPAFPGNAQPYTFPLMVVPIVAHGGLYAPYIAESTGIACVKAVRFYYGDPRLNAPSATADQLWGDGAAGIGPYGGSGNIHYSNHMASSVIWPVLRMSRLSAAASSALANGAHRASLGSDGKFTVPSLKAGATELGTTKSGPLTAIGSFRTTGQLIFAELNGAPRLGANGADVLVTAGSPNDSAYFRCGGNGWFATLNGGITNANNYEFGADNVFSIGTAAKRASAVYAGTGTINTSDAREKTPVRPLTDEEMAAARAMAREIGVFQWLSAIEDKGDAARLHVGMTVQRAIEIMEAHDLDPLSYGFICHDTWSATEAQEAISEEVEGEDGEMVPILIQPAVPAREAGDRYGFRADALLLFLTRGFDARLTALENA